MDVDVPVASSSHSNSASKALKTVELPDPSVFDLSLYADNYSGRRRAQRLLFIARACPTLALEAYTLAAATLKESTLDYTLYSTAIQEHNTALNNFKKECASAEHPTQAALAAADKTPLAVDQSWADATRRSSNKELDKLEVELKNYQNNLIKESIRMGYRDLGNYYHRAGELQLSIRSHTKSRDFCSTPSHVVEMCLSVIEVALEMQNYAFVRNYVVKAEAAMEALSGQANGTGANGSNAAQAKKQQVNLPGMVATGATREEEAAEREKNATIERLAIALGVADLGQGNYYKAGINLLRIGSGVRQADALHYIAPNDIALYATLCALATFERPHLKRRVVDNAELRPLLELEPHLKEIVAAFYESKYKLALELLDRYHPRAALDLHLNPHLPALMTAIKNRAVVQYFSPFGSVSLERMASAFGWSEEAMMRDVVELVQSGNLKARIDTKNKVLKAYNPSQRSELFKRALEVGKETEKTNRALLLRMKLLQADLIVKEPKGIKQTRED